MIVIIDDEKWMINAYIDELENKSIKNKKFKPKHFFYPKEALEFIKNEYLNINLIILDIGMDYGDGNFILNEYGGLRLFKEIKSNININNISIIILTVFEYFEIKKNINILNDPHVRFINRYQINRDNLLFQYIESVIKKGCF